MSLYLPTWEPNLHRDAYTAFLKSHLKPRGEKQRFAQKLGIEPETLSYILADISHPDNPKTTYLVPGRDLCHRIAEVIEVHSEEKERLLEHLLLSRQESQEAKQRQVDVGHMRDITLEELKQIVTRAYEATDPNSYGSETYALPLFLLGVIQNTSAEDHPLIVAQAALSMCGIDDNRGYHMDSLYYANLSRLILMYFRERPPRGYEMEWQDAQYGSILATSMAYSNLRLFKLAYQSCEEVKQLPFLVDHPEWQIHAYAHEIKALSNIPRISISKLERVVDNAELLYAKKENTDAALHLSVVYRRIADAYTERGWYLKAENVLVNKINSLPLSAQPPIYQVGLQRAWARLKLRQGDQIGWQMYITSTLELSERAGLSAQIVEIQKEYGNDLNFE